MRRSSLPFLSLSLSLSLSVSFLLSLSLSRILVGAGEEVIGVYKGTFSGSTPVDNGYGDENLKKAGATIQAMEQVCELGIPPPPPPPSPAYYSEAASRVAESTQPVWRATCPNVAA